MDRGRPKDRTKETLDNLEKYNASPEQLLAALDELQATCRNGYTQQKQTAKGVVVELEERDMKTALNCIEAKFAIVQNLMKSYDPGEDEKDYEFKLTVINAPPALPVDDLGDF